MKVSELYRKDSQVFSLEVFPPRDGNFSKVYNLVEELNSFDPAFISVTCGAMGRPSDTGSLELASRIKQGNGIEAVVHFPCIGKSRDEIEVSLSNLVSSGIENVLALRGDPPRDHSFAPDPRGFRYASELVAYLRQKSKLGIGVAGYPEGHPECVDANGRVDLKRNVDHLKLKVDAGADYVLTQMFFDENLFFEFLNRTTRAGIDVPIVPGVMVIQNYNQVSFVQNSIRISMPRELKDRIETYKDKQAELGKYLNEHTLKICRTLLEGNVPGIHLFTMNDAAGTKMILEELVKKNKIS